MVHHPSSIIPISHRHHTSPRRHVVQRCFGSETPRCPSLCPQVGYAALRAKLSILSLAYGAIWREMPILKGICAPSSRASESMLICQGSVLAQLARSRWPRPSGSQVTSGKEVGIPNTAWLCTHHPAQHWCRSPRQSVEDLEACEHTHVEATVRTRHK